MENEILTSLKAKNSSGEQQLSLMFQPEDRSIFFTLFGSLNGDNIQVDFDEITLQELEDFKAGVELIIGLAKNAGPVPPETVVYTGGFGRVEVRGGRLVSGESPCKTCLNEQTCQTMEVCNAAFDGWEPKN